MSEPLYLAKSEDGYPALLPQMANRHGLIQTIWLRQQRCRWLLGFVNCYLYPFL